jgi:N-acetylglucosamine-6-phosphate deacetylase
MTILAGAGLVASGLSSHEPGWIEVEGERIVGLGNGTPAGATVVEDAVLVPGFVDLQVNGIGSADFAVPDPVVWRSALLAQGRRGVTGCCPTLVSAPLDAYAEPLAVAASLVAASSGARVLGVHLEGPFLGGAPGAHVVEYLRPVDRPWLATLLDRFPALIRIVTLAPEADPGLDGTRALHAAGVVVAIGHTTATYDDARAAADAGASLVTHVFNGMGPFHHRRPGVVGAALDDARLTPSIIADLVHVHPAALRIAIRSKRSLALITDAVAVGAAGVGAGTNGALTTEERDGAARLADGTLAGAVVTMDQAVRNVVALGFPLERAVELASTVPCEILGDTERGRLEPGRRADIVALDRDTLAVRAVWIAGRPVPLDQADDLTV